MLPDGIYDAIVVEADGDGDAGAVRLELAILAGEHKGDVIAVRAERIASDPIELLGVPATVVVGGGKPHVSLET